MDSDQQHYQLLQIVIAAAWVDGHLEAAEVGYLDRLMQRYGYDRDPHLRALLSQPVSLRQTEQWIAAYLSQAGEGERMKLLAALGNLLIADNEVSPPEHRLLDDFYALMETIPAHAEATPKLVQAVGKFFRRMAKVVQTGELA
ncbi:MAG: TerB family tellurite resistance protein [Cyanobacteriota bacterium]|nr:TerB family tellurite resistance protein [Cyanobacteriota bacterium]